MSFGGGCFRAGFTRHVQIIAPSQHPGRLKRAMESMGATEADLRRGWWDHDNSNWRIRNRATPDRLRQIARTYARHVGLTDA